MTSFDSMSERIRILSEKREQEFFFEIKSAFLRKDGDWKNCFSLIKLMHSSLTKKLIPEKFNYGNFILEKWYFSLHDGINILKNIEEGKFEVDSYQSRELKVYGKSEFIGSGKIYWHFSMDWPTRSYRYYSENDRQINIERDHLVHVEYPLFSDISEALRIFFNMEVTQSYYDFSEKGQVWILIPDYRAKIRELKISYTKILITIDTNFLDEKDLIIKIFAKSGTESYNSPILKLNDGYTEFDCKKDLDYVLAYLLTGSGEPIDFKEWSLGWEIRDKTIIVERPGEQIKNIIQRGEGLNVEFKVNIDNRQDFLETIVSFSNTSGGIIIIGVDDNGQIKGFRGNNDDILKIIRDSCEPLITPRIKIYDYIDGFPLTVLEIDSGVNKPYLLKSRGIAYVRHGSNDFPPSRSELDQLYTKSRSGHSTYI